MKNKIIYLILGVWAFLLLGLFLNFPKTAHAMFADGGGGGGGGFGTTIYVNAYNSGTIWKTHLVYTRNATGQTFTTTINSGSSWDLGFTISSNDTLSWLTACVDPESNITAFLNVSCRSYDAYSTSNCQSIMNAENPISCGVAYGACGGPNDYVSAGSSGSYSSYAVNLGTVAYGMCPIPNAHPGPDSNSYYNRFRCSYRGHVSSAGELGCRGTCTYRYCSNNGTYGTWATTPYSSNCFSGNTCAPPPPTVTSTPSCVNNAASISTTWSTVSYASGVDDFRYKKSTDTTWIYDYDAPEPKVLNGLSDSTIYNIGVRSHTTYGHAGPTDWAQVNVTTGACSRPNLTVSAFTFPNGYVGASGNASVTVANNGGISTGVGFNVSVRDGTTSNVWTTTTTALGAGTSRALSIPVTLPPTAGTYTAVATADSTNVITESNETDNTRTDSYTATANALTVHVCNDFNGNGVEDAVDTDSVGRTVTITGLGAGTYTTNAAGNVVINNLAVGSSTITVAVPSGWTSTTTNPRTVSLPPSQTVNFCIRPPAPTCTSLTANPTNVAPGGTSLLTCNNPTSPTGDTLTYNWFPDSAISGFSDTVNPVTSTTPTTTWTAPNPWWTQVTANPSVSVCNPGGTCSNYQAAITVAPRFTIAGNVFVDANKDALKNAGESNYTSGTSTIEIRTGSCGGPLVQSINSANGVFTTGQNLTGGTYYVCYTTLPVGYKMTVPVNGPPASFSVTIGNASTGGACAPGSYCDANGNIANLNFGITNSIPWIQTTEGDVYITSGSQIPGSSPTCGPYMSLQGGGGTPGIIFCGSATCNFGGGQASQNPYNWQVGGSTYPEVYTPKSSELKTSYNSMLATAQRSGITPTPLGGSQCGAGGISSCVLAAGLANGVYIANGNLTLTGASYTFGANRDVVILVNGNLNINTEIHVPVGSTALFTTSGDINVAANVGEATITSIRSNVEGYYSTDKNFYVLGNNSCPTSDRRLNVAGSVVVNAAFTGGSLIYQRDLCAGNLQCPVFMVLERPDFILNAPDFLKSTRRIWQEIAP